MWKAIHDHIHHISGFGATSQASNERLTSTAEETPKPAALKFRSDAELEPSEAHTELIFLSAKKQLPYEHEYGGVMGRVICHLLCT